MAVGLLAFCAALLQFGWVMLALMVMFVGLWCVALISWFGFVFGKLTGRYRNLTPRPWKNQVW
jgi:hypothetical protein